MPLTPEQRSLRAQVASNARWSTEQPTRANATPGQAALLAKFEQQVDPDGTLPPDERTRRAQAARRAHMARLALRSSKARKQTGAAAVSTRDLVAKAEASLRELVASAPVPSPEQIEVLRRLLPPSGGAGGETG